MAYLLDANVLIEAKNKHYGFAICPGFWDWLLSANTGSHVFIAQPVLAEIKKGKDQLMHWCSANGSLCLKSVPNLAKSLGAVSTWVSAQSYTSAAVSQFLSVADYQLVAFAHAGNHTVVTHEIPGLSLNRVKIPEACKALGVKYMSPFKMLEKEGAKLVV